MSNPRSSIDRSTLTIEEFFLASREHARKQFTEEEMKQMETIEKQYLEAMRLQGITTMEQLMKNNEAARNIRFEHEPVSETMQELKLQFIDYMQRSGMTRERVDRMFERGGLLSIEDTMRLGATKEEADDIICDMMRVRLPYPSTTPRTLPLRPADLLQDGLTKDQFMLQFDDYCQRTGIDTPRRKAIILKTAFVDEDSMDVDK